MAIAPVRTRSTTSRCDIHRYYNKHYYPLDARKRLHYLPSGCNEGTESVAEFVLSDIWTPLTLPSYVHKVVITSLASFTIEITTRDPNALSGLSVLTLDTSFVIVPNVSAVRIKGSGTVYIKVFGANKRPTSIHVNEDGSWTYPQTQPLQV